VSRGLALVAVVGLLAGCAAFGWQSDSIAVPRDPLLVAYGEARATFQLADFLFARTCQAGHADETLCKIGAELKTRALALDALLQAALVDKRGSLTPQDLQRFIQLGAQLAALAGMPQLGALGALGPK
jgi:hypothetical protein